jgi:hypothetical protein
MNQDILNAMAKAFFASAWADQAEEAGESLSGKEIFDVMPAIIDKHAWHAARILYMQMQAVNGVSMETLYERAKLESGNPDFPIKDFGHYAAMEAQGHGVGLFDYGIFGIMVPYIEFGSHSLERDYFGDES